MLDFINRYVGEAQDHSETSNETLSETGSTPPLEESSEEESDVISNTMNWSFLDYVEHLLILSRSDEGDELDIARTKVIQNSWSSIDERAMALHKALLIKANKLYKQSLASLNLIKRQDSKRELEQNYYNSLLKISLLNKKEFTAKNIEKIDMQTILKMDHSECKLYQEKASVEHPQTQMEKLISALINHN